MLQSVDLRVVLWVVDFAAVLLASSALLSYTIRPKEPLDLHHGFPARASKSSVEKNVSVESSLIISLWYLNLQ